jgi:hypothetical protein
METVGHSHAFESGAKPKPFSNKIWISVTSLYTGLVLNKCTIAEKEVQDAKQ